MLRSMILVFVLLISGCVKDQYVPVRQPQPIIESPARPVMSPLSAEELLVWKAIPAEMREKLVKQNNDLQSYALQLEASVNTYNSWAKKVNDLNEKYLNLAPERKK